MKQRCLNPKSKDWKNYGARGVTVHPPWVESFETFWADMARGYQPYLSLGRVDNDKGYEPGNCRWETYTEQGNNTRCNQWVDTPKGRMTLTQAAIAYGMSPQKLNYRLKRWPLAEALTRP